MRKLNSLVKITVIALGLLSACDPKKNPDPTPDNSVTFNNELKNEKLVVIAGQPASIDFTATASSGLSKLKVTRLVAGEVDANFVAVEYAEADLKKDGSKYMGSLEQTLDESLVDQSVVYRFELTDKSNKLTTTDLAVRPITASYGTGYLEVFDNQPDQNNSLIFFSIDAYDIEKEAFTSISVNENGGFTSKIDFAFDYNGVDGAALRSLGDYAQGLEFVPAEWVKNETKFALLDQNVYDAKEVVAIGELAISERIAKITEMVASQPTTSVSVINLKADDLIVFETASVRGNKKGVIKITSLTNTSIEFVVYFIRG